MHGNTERAQIGQKGLEKAKINTIWTESGNYPECIFAFWGVFRTFYRLFGGQSYLYMETLKGPKLAKKVLKRRK